MKKSAYRLLPVLVLMLVVLTGAGCAKSTENNEQKTNTTPEIRVDAMKFQNGMYKVITASSTADWHGAKVTGEHFGAVDIASGNFMVENGKPVSGELKVDLETISNKDITDEKMQKMLLDHLKSEEFFGVAVQKEAVFTLKSFEPVSGDRYKVTGDLSIKNITNEIIFEADVVSQGDMLMISANIELDRTLWDMKFGSGKFFADLGDKLVYDNFDVEINLVAQMQK